MASNRSAGGDSSHGSWPGSPHGDEPGPSPVHPPHHGGTDGPDGYDTGLPGPVAEHDLPARGRHRVPKQRGGSMARSGAVLGVGVIAAVGAGGMASAQERPAAISVPDVGPHLFDDGDDDEESTDAEARAEAARAPEAADLAQGSSDAGEALRARILQQAEHQRDSAGAEVTHEAQERAEADARRMAAAKVAAATKLTAERKAQATASVRSAAESSATAHSDASQAAAGARQAGQPHSAPRTAGQASKARADAAAQAGAAKAASRAQSETRRAADRINATRAKRTYVMPVSSYRITARFGQSGGMWSHRHTGTDFAAPTGTPVKAVHGGRITHAGWAGSYGYRIVLRLDDGTELWFCHLSSIVRTKGKVAAGQVIGRVGATGNVTGAHLHLEVRPHGGHPVDPLHWLRSKGLRP